MVQPLVVAALAMVALYEVAIAISCLCRHPRARIPALALFLSAPLQVLSALFSGRLLAAWHTPSSFDPLGDGFDLLFQEVALTGGLALLPIAFGMWMVICLLVGGIVKVAPNLPLQQTADPHGFPET